MQRMNVRASSILHVCHRSQFVAGSIHASNFTRLQHLRQFHASRTAAGSGSNDSASISASKLDLSEDALELVNSTSALSSGILSTSADLFLSLPQLFGGAPYALSIVLMTIALRSSITMPLTVWQRRRVRRVQEKVVPAAKKWMAVARYNLRTEFRRAGKGYEEYVAELSKQAKQQFKKLAAHYRCRPLATMLLPPLIHLPVFIGTTLTIREACNKSESSLQLVAQAINEDPLAATVNDRLTSLALESFHWCPSLTDVDPYSALPVLVGLTALLNVELQANIRQTLAQLRDTAMDDPSATSSHLARSGNKSSVTNLQGATTPAMTPKHTTPARPASSVPRVLQQKKALSTSDGASPKTDVPPALSSQQSVDKSAMRSRAITNVLRFASIVFIPVAAASPVAVNLYWITSNLYSLFQNLSLAYIDKTKHSR